MRWEDERYVRVYTRDTPEWIALSWEARAVFYELTRKVDRAGLVPVGRSGLRGLAGLLRMPFEVVQRGLEGDDGLLADGCVMASDWGYLIPNFTSAQEAKQSDRLRKSEQRDRERVERFGHSVQKNQESGQTVTHRDDLSRTVTKSHDWSHGVTRRHTESHGVTPCLAMPSLAMLTESPVGPLSVAVTPESLPAAPVANTKPARSTKGTRCPESVDPDAPAWLAAHGIPALASAHGADVAMMLDHFAAAPAAKACKSNWSATWRNWARSEIGTHPVGPADGHTPKVTERDEPKPPPPVFRTTDPSEPIMDLSKLTRLALGQ